MTQFKDIIVAVHGIGKQLRSETVRSVATRFAASNTLREQLRGGGVAHPVAPQPLGYFHSEVRNLTSINPLDDLAVVKRAQLGSMGFSEVFWSDIPQQVINEGRTLEETKAWAGTVIARAEALCRRAKEDPKRNWIVPPDFSLASEVLGEVIDTVRVMENLVFLAGKAGLFKFDLAQVLQEYLGDVQLVTEFTYFRNDVLGRFHAAMQSIYQQQHEAGNSDVRIHIIAHSEGTVVSFLGLLYAMSKQSAIPADSTGNIAAELKPDKDFPPWLQHVKSFMTIGSPIDKHLLLWPRLWQSLNPDLANDLFKGREIRWRNYYDYGDPVGFKLDSARLWLKHTKCQSFQFCDCPKCHHDIGFARYILPGEAHNEYWKDPDVFEHFINSAMFPKDPPAPPPEPPKTKWFVFFLSPTLPYLLSFLLLCAGTFIFFKTVHHYTHPQLDPLQRYVRFMALGLKPTNDLFDGRLVRAVIGTAALIFGASLLARFARLARGAQWALAGVAAYLAGSICYATAVPSGVRDEIGSAFTFLGPNGPTLGVLALAFIGGGLGFLASSGKGNPDRSKRLIWRGTRPLMVCGALTVAAVVLSQIWRPNPALNIAAMENIPAPTTNQIQLIKEARLSSNEVRQIMADHGTNWPKLLEKTEPVLATHPSAWPVFGAGLAFLYLWWLAILIFDLSFVWQRYIRHSITNRRLLEWNPYGLDHRDKDNEQCCNLPEKDH